MLETHSGAASVPLSPATPCPLSPQVSTSHSPICPPKRKSALLLSFPSQLKSSQDSSKATEDPTLTMKSFSFSTTAALLAVVSLGSTLVLLTSAQSHIRCQNTIGGPCGDSSRAREMNCCDYGYCQPWNSGYYQCLDKPALCPTQETDIDYYGNDLKTIYGILPAACCDQCSKTADCRGYTFVNENPDGKSACYLKSALTGRAEKKGAVSGALATPPTPTPSPPPSTCQNTIGASCGNAQGTTCCPDGSFCQPWNSGYYQCIKNPQLCSTMRTDVDLPGNDLKTIYGILPSDCCDQCGKTGGCRAFTFVNENPDGKSACYLKSSGSGQQVAKKGALSAVLIYDPIPTPVTPAPTPSPTECQTPVGAPCGNAQTGPKCCNNDGFCQPWNAGYYQCVAKPADAKCPTVVVGVDFYGMDIETKFGLLPDSCCDACYNHKDCRVFTFVNENADGKSACYLKSGLGEQRARASAISGYKNKLANYP